MATMGGINIIGPRLLGAELRWEVFNAANHPIFALPDATLSSAAYDTISTIIVDSRPMQLECV
jgi:hypothetical protein